MQIARLRTAALPALAVLLAAADAGAQRLSTACEALDPSAEAPSLPRTSYADSLHAAIHLELRDEMRRAAVAAGVAEPSGYLVLQHDRRTGGATHRMVRGNVPRRVIEDVHRRMSARLSETPREDAVVFFGMRLDPFPWAAVDAVPAEVACAPELLNLRTLQGRLGAVLERTAPRGNPPIQTTLRMVVTRDGEVAYAYLERGTGILAMDRALVRQVAPSLRFAPARIDEETIDVWAELPIVFPERQPPPPPGAEEQWRP